MSSLKDLKEGEAPVEPITPKAGEGEIFAQVFIIFFLFNFIFIFISITPVSHWKIAKGECGVLLLKLLFDGIMM